MGVKLEAMKKPLISVVVPIYNTERYLDKCLQSILNQTFERIEIICVDDCSPDNSGKIVEKYQRKDSRVILIRHQKNKGQGGARNTAIRTAKADFIASVDSDDAIRPNMLEVLWNESEGGYFDIVCCGFSRIDENGNILQESKFNSRMISNNDYKAINIFTIMNPSIWNKLWRKSLFVDNAIFFPEKLYYQDMATIPLLVAKSQKIKFIEDVLYNYLVRNDSVTNTFSDKHIIDYFKIYGVLYDQLKRLNIEDQYLNQLFRYVNEGMRFHSSNVVQSSMNTKEKKQYLRHLLMLKVSFLQLHSHLTSKTESELLLLLETVTTVEAVLPPPYVELEKVESLELSSTQLLGCKLFSTVFSLLIKDAHRGKLESDPRAFFVDSKNKYTRIIGHLLRVI